MSGLGTGIIPGVPLLGAALPPAGSPPTLRVGSSGPWVRYLHERLTDLGVHAQSGYYVALETFDQETKRRVEFLQTAYGLTVDGIVGSQTWGILGVSGGGSSYSSPPVYTPPSPLVTMDPVTITGNVPGSFPVVPVAVAAGVALIVLALARK